jgi:hypothetical protein
MMPCLPTEQSIIPDLRYGRPGCLMIARADSAYAAEPD